jgi:hypothetical protein
VAGGAAAAWAGDQPVLYCTDLFHPHVDPDDHFDLATLYALPGVEIAGIVLDQGAKQQKQPGRIPVSQLNRLSGRQVPVATGLATPLASPGDTGRDQPAGYQGGVRMFADTRNLWCTVLFGALAGQCVVAGTSGPPRFEPDGVERQAPPAGALFTFESVEVTVDAAGTVRCGTGPQARRVWRFKVLDPARYAAGMTAATSDRLAAFPLGRAHDRQPR